MPPSGEKRKNVSFEDALEFFTNKHSSNKVRGNQQLSVCLDALDTESSERGLPPDAIVTLLDVACSLKFPESVSMRLVKSLIPEDKVPEQAAIRAVSWMCTNTFSSNMQALLVKWLILIYEMLDTTEKLHALYTFIFYFLEDEIICPYACHLLYLMTRKEDVKAFRIRSLIQLQSKMGQQPYIQGLLSVYKLYCPHLVAISIPASSLRRRHGFFKQIDRKWSAKVRAIQNNNAARSEDTDNELANIALTKLPASKRQRRSDIVRATSSAVILSDDTGQPNTLDTVPFTQVKSFKQLLKNLDRLELPSQLAAALHNSNLQHVLLCYPDPAIPLRIGNWLDQVLNQEFFNEGVTSAAEEARREYLLRLLIQFSEFLQEGVPACEHFLARLLHVWDGKLYAPLVLRLLTRLRLDTYTVLYDLVFEPLRKLFFCSSVYCKCQIMRCFTVLLQNFASVEYPRYLYSKQLQLDHSLSPSSLPLQDCFSVFSEEWTEDFDAVDTMRQFVQFVNSIAGIGLQAEDDNAVLMHYVLDFFEVVSTLYTSHGVSVFELPGPGVVYKAMFSCDAATLSRLSDIINNYRDDYRRLKEENKAQEKEQAIQQLNSYIVDISNSLWTDKAFVLPKHKGKQVLRSIYEYFPSEEFTPHRSAFSLHQHQAMLGLVRQFMYETQPEDSRHHPRSLKSSRDVFMEFLCLESIPGVVNFINRNIHRR